MGEVVSIEGNHLTRARVAARHAAAYARSKGLPERVCTEIAVKVHTTIKREQSSAAGAIAQARQRTNAESRARGPEVA